MNSTALSVSKSFLFLIVVGMIQFSCQAKRKVELETHISETLKGYITNLPIVSVKVVSIPSNCIESFAENSEMNHIYNLLNSVKGKDHVEPDGSIIEEKMYNFIYKTDVCDLKKLEVLLYYIHRFPSASRNIYSPIVFGAYHSKRDNVDKHPLFLLPLFNTERAPLTRAGIREFLKMGSIEVPSSIENYVQETLVLITLRSQERNAKENCYWCNYDHQIWKKNLDLMLVLTKTKNQSK